MVENEIEIHFLKLNDPGLPSHSISIL